jgi:hypothetical protein
MILADGHATMCSLVARLNLDPRLTFQIDRLSAGADEQLRSGFYALVFLRMFVELRITNGFRNERS